MLAPDWTGAHVWFGDERAVPPDDERSNYRLVRATLLDALARLPETHRIRGELGAEEAAALYDEELAGVTLDLALGRDRRRRAHRLALPGARRRSRSGSGGRSRPSRASSRSSRA